MTRPIVAAMSTEVNPARRCLIKSVDTATGRAVIIYGDRMATPDYVRAMRARIGHDLLLLPGVSAVVRDEDGRVLLVQRTDNGRWSVPAGFVEPGEQPAEAAAREAYEETGVEVEVVAVGGVATHPVEYPNGDRCEYLNVWFRCRPIGGTPRADNDESLAAAWFAPDDLPDLDDWSRLRLTTTEDPIAPAWHVPPGDSHPALKNPHFL